MRATVVIAAHNEGELLARTIESCIESCGDLDYEIVVADDASTDGSVDTVARRFPHVRVFRHEQRRGASPTKALGSRHAQGAVLVFLDGHTKPEGDAIARLVREVEELDGGAILTPTVAALDAQRWRTNGAEGHGYALDLWNFDCRWQPLEMMRPVANGAAPLYESPALIGCAFAVSCTLYDKIRGFDPGMRSWGIEDLDLSLKCWLMGYPILHDPRARIGHRFRTRFDTYAVPVQDVLTNKLRMARKNFTYGVWAAWLEGCRHSNQGPLAGHEEGLWAHIWQLFEADRAGVEHERSYLHGHRVHDEFWYAERFGQTWPRLAAQARPAAQFAAAAPSPSPSPVRMRVIRAGDITKANPFTICIVANPALESPTNSGTFIGDPIMSDIAGFDACVQYINTVLFGNLPGQAEKFITDPAVGPNIRIVSLVVTGLPAQAANALVGEDNVSNLLVGRQAAFAPFLSRFALSADVAYAVSKSATQTRATAWFTHDDNSRGGVPFTLDGATLSHRFFNTAPGTVAIHSTATSLTALHEFGHALSSWENGMIVDLYVDNDGNPGAKVNRKLGRPIPENFGVYQGTTIVSDMTRDSLGYPANWQSYHCQLNAPTFPAIMDNYWAASGPPINGKPEQCQHDVITRRFLLDRLKAKVSR